MGKRHLFKREQAGTVIFNKGHPKKKNFKQKGFLGAGNGQNPYCRDIYRKEEETNKFPQRKKREIYEKRYRAKTCKRGGDASGN